MKGQIFGNDQVKAMEEDQAKDQEQDGGELTLKGRADWKWHAFSNYDEATRALKDNHHFLKWAKESRERDSNYLSAISFQRENNAVFGTLIIGDAKNDRDKTTFFHFLLTEKALYTIQFEQQAITDRCERSALFFEHAEEADTALDGFVHLLAGVMEPFFEGMDRFETKLRKTEESLRNHNGGYMFRQIVDLRYRLLHWTGLTRPIREIKYALEEAFPDQMEKSKIYKALQSRLERMIMLQSEYNQELESLLLLEENISNYRGNEIMKTLTVFTILCTPMMAIGAVWGMNFENMPELKWKTGYWIALGVIFSSTVGVYIWMRSKGWMGDLLRDDNRREEM
ncbi:magnesium transporter CorA family protein [Paenibacillus herberti]|uniref:Magnesium transporter CorA n=1 Tax=Paenibacillus herberti TaxID=1619309 RepID=A0A229NV29_9BACL|nr:magnesium transporter CorA family protein [Paenibacillus herberti]OXM13763.1 hypothetical protein CGZ75_22380 [Paenibacillus herberti]